MVLRIANAWPSQHAPFSDRTTRYPAQLFILFRRFTFDEHRLFVYNPQHCPGRQGRCGIASQFAAGRDGKDARSLKSGY